MQDLGDLHALELTVVLDLIHTAVNDGVVDIEIGLGIDDLGQIVTAGSGKETTHLDRQLGNLSELLQLRRDRSEALLLFRVSSLGEIVDRKACAAKLNDGTIVITPDNGTLTHLLHSPGVREVREIDESVNRYRGGDHSEVFHGRDLFGYTAAKLASGLITFEEVGPQYPIVEIVECEEYYSRPVFTEGFDHQRGICDLRLQAG